MRHLKLRKELDEYMAIRALKKPVKKPLFKNLFKRNEFRERHITINEHQINTLKSTDQTEVVIVDNDPNFFKIIHNKILEFFKPKEKSKNDE